ncbi:MAG TPA: thiamine-phosphate kinase [Verrucomicrobiae bacterium]
MNEFELIAKLTKTLPTNESVTVGAGDDCAVLDLGLKDQSVLFKTDAVVEGVHFTAETEPERIGHKALGRCLSDIAAMGGTPTHALVTLGLPKDYDPERISQIYRGMSALALRYNVAIVGGETTTNPGCLLISVALLGTVKKDKAALRKGAQVGDAIFVTGNLGGSLSGKHLDFEPRLAEGRWLMENFSLSSMMDVSDGLAGDLRHIMKQSGVGALLFAAMIPVSREAKVKAREKTIAKPAILAALTDGEDFELLFTLPPNEAVKLKDAWKEQFPNLPLSCIGKITKQPGLHLKDERGVRELHDHGYVHHAQS